MKNHFQHASFANQIPPCQDFKAKIIECYRRNPSETLRCAGEVQQFMNCINSARVVAVDTKGKKPAASA